jgi:TPR repeat protein
LEKAFRCFETGHELDPWNPESLYWLADSYYQGHGVLKNEEKAVALYQRAADMGHAGAQTAIGDAHAQCGFTCLPKNEKKAARWYQAAAEQGDEEAVCMIVDMYQRGEGVKQDRAEAARLLRNAVARGDETARHNLRLYAKQYGSPYEDDDADTP